MNQPLSDYNFVEGEILLFDKPLDWTSFDVVSKVRYLLCNNLGIKKLKVGHAGTLDPKATGLVVLCTGKATKRIESIQAQEKEYIATIKLGATTPSFDLESDEDHFFETKHITINLIEEKIKEFLGEIDQVPPIFSAIRVNGKRAFDYARGGQELELKSRKIQIDAIKIVNFELPFLTLKVNCGKGTYIRSLARDLGLSLESGAYLTALRRTRIGENRVEDGFNLETFKIMLDQM